ncbi:MAG TPA: hypothetical protein VN948_24180 [Terriglobales bacterium]|nr:hypothetical protein [Terriglobales bacterium]
MTLVVTGYHHRGLSGVGVALAIRRVNPAQRIAVITAESSVVVRSVQRKLRDIPAGYPWPRQIQLAVSLEY